MPAHLQCRIDSRKISWDPITCLYEKGKRVLKLHSKFTVLVVNDNFLSFQAMKKNEVPRVEVELHYAKNGLQGFQKYQEMAKQQYAYHMIFMALQMEGMDGAKSTKMIRSYEQENILPRT